MKADAPILEVSDLHTHYGASHILHGVDFSVARGECLSLMGRNGMGKTTTIRSIFGLTPASKGEVRVFGNVVTSSAPHVIARQGLGLVPEGREIFANLSVEENLLMTARPGRDGSTGWTLERVLETFPRLAERLSNMGNHLSGGEQQMLAIGRALMTNPDLLVLDEATEGLAPLIRKEIWAVVRRIKETGIATILVDKDVDALLSVSDKCLILVKGKAVFSGSSDELAANPDIHVQHLGV
ncbi:MAG: ABC transporter ATP-binding protein [Rhodospirillaceae bacterium]|jgi:branched-chain amino acid transport system ATP-binding protein|nr:ABC transporter ATP-binding protein [Rhodospirillaceae bacterium]MBT5243830.1 ABC transporter ATP-binding protein [Rhodospirillaceae bacterium]MBT5562879.1 ABC transporter ATP-binding protein [Rhodospirillaceae bacterium]MBT6241278.1 ABC transporter ATP-binding protein [Rhodospirillaceae bacterium]MBT7137128.1 ABC transporter ATP-binding protein [Rhodospirillaceae bacterium]